VNDNYTAHKISTYRDADIDFGLSGIVKSSNGLNIGVDFAPDIRDLASTK